MSRKAYIYFYRGSATPISVAPTEDDAAKQRPIPPTRCRCCQAPPNGETEQHWPRAGRKRKEAVCICKTIFFSRLSFNNKRTIRAGKSCIMILWLHLYKCVLMTSHSDDVTRSQNRQNFELVYLRQYLSSSVHIENASGYLAGIFNVPYHFEKKKFSRATNGGHFENYEISNTDSILPQIWKDRPQIMP